LIASFAIYLASVGWAIRRGTLTAPENSDSGDSDNSSDSSEDESISGDRTNNVFTVRGHDDAENDRQDFTEPPDLVCDEQTPFLDSRSSATQPPPRPGRRRTHTLRYHVSYLLLGFLAICLAGYVLSHAATTIVDEFNLSDVLFGVVILAIATTLPEKFIAVMSGQRGSAGVLVANTAGSNIFLLTLCSGIVMLDTNESFESENISVFELGLLWGSTIAFTSTVWFGTRFGRLIGLAMIVSYITFIVLEIAVIHGVANHD
jgi:hypothetical protein